MTSSFTERGAVGVAAIIGGLTVIVSALILGVVNYQANHTSTDNRSQAAVTSCSGQPESVCKATLGCKWVPAETTTTPHTCTPADCNAGKSGCEWETVAGSKGICSGDVNQQTGMECMSIITQSACTGGCSWNYPSQQSCQGSYTTSSTTAAKCEGSPVCPDPCTSHAQCGSGFYCDGSASCPSCKAQVCTPNQTVSCTNGWLRVCNTIGSKVDPQTECDFGCNSAGTACNTPPPQAYLCQSDSDCGVNQYCYQPASGTAECRTKTSTCTKDTLRCKDATYVERCSASGTWIAEKCAAGCNQSINRCNTICTPNTYRCDGQALQQCGSLGADWLPIQACPQGTTCNASSASCQSSSSSSPPPTTSPTPPGNTSLLPDKSPCSSSNECQSNNCQSTPFGRVCLAAGTTMGEYTVTKEGDFCGSTSFGVYACDTSLGLKCVEGACFKLKANNQTCTTPNQCQSGNCQLTQSGRICLAAGVTVSAKVAAGNTCGTTAYNRECVDGYTCQNNRCVIITATTPTSPTPPPTTAPTNLTQLATACAANPSLPACQSYQQTLNTYQENYQAHAPQNNQEFGIATLQTLNALSFGTFGNYVASNVAQNEAYGYGTEDYDYWDRVSNYENIRAATEFGGVMASYLAGSVYANAAITGGLSTKAALTGGLSAVNLFSSTSNTAAVCQTPEDYQTNPLCKTAVAQNALALAWYGVAPLTAGAQASTLTKAASTAINAGDTALAGYNTATYCQQYGADGTCLLFGATTALSGMGTFLDATNMMTNTFQTNSSSTKRPQPPKSLNEMMASNSYVSENIPVFNENAFLTLYHGTPNIDDLDSIMKNGFQGGFVAQFSDTMMATPLTYAGKNGYIFEVVAPASKFEYVEGLINDDAYFALSRNNNQLSSTVSNAVTLSPEYIQKVHIVGNEKRIIDSFTPQVAINNQIEISKLHPHEPGYNIQSTKKLTQALEEGSVLPPVSITEYNGTLVTYDGANRITANLEVGNNVIDYQFSPFSSLDKTQQAVVLNALGIKKFTPTSIPSSYINFPAAYDYAPSW